MGVLRGEGPEPNPTLLPFANASPRLGGMGGGGRGKSKRNAFGGLIVSSAAAGFRDDGRTTRLAGRGRAKKRFLRAFSSRSVPVRRARTWSSSSS